MERWQQLEEYVRSNMEKVTGSARLTVASGRFGDADVLAGIGASAALSISDAPFEGPIATVRVAKIEDKFVVNPTFKELENAELEFLVSGSEDSITMVEGEAKEVSEEIMLEAIEFSHIEIKKSLNYKKN